MDLELKGKVVIVSGGAGEKGSIGRTIVQSLTNEGAIPVIIDKNDRGHEIVSELKSQGIDALFIQTNLMAPEQIESAVMEVTEKYGKVDAVINNIGVNDGVGLNGT